MGVLLFSCDKIQQTNYSKDKFAVLSCDVECKDQSQEKKHSHSFSNGSEKEVSLGGIVSTEESFSGDKSILLLASKAMYGFTTKLKDAKVDEYYKVSVWRKDKKGKACLVAQAENAPILYLAKKEVREKGENGWEKIEFEFEVPPAAGTITIYAYIAKADSAYFDQLKIERMNRKQYAEFPNRQVLNLYFTDKKMNKFEASRENAFKEGVHFSDGNWNKGTFSTGEDILPIKARFKGDWLDHLKGRKWSFRIKVRKGKAFNRMRQFSLQTPASRYYLHEYLAHQLFIQEGLLTTRYDFAPLYINQKSRGMYAIEEHFTKQLVEYNLRREGPILKFDEDPMWRNIALHNGLGKVSGWNQKPDYTTSRVTAFGFSKILESEKLKNQFHIAQSLLYQLKNRTAPIDELFEVDKLAKFLALTDLHNGRHGAIWHNLRFYYNPISCKIELINYDNFTSDFPLHKHDKPLALSFNQQTNLYPWENLFPYFFTSDEVCKQYIEYLEKFSSRDYISNFYTSQQAKVEEYLPLIQQEFPRYKLDSTFLLNNAQRIRKFLPEIKQKYKEGYFRDLKVTDNSLEYSNKYFEAIFPYFLNAYYYQKNGEAELKLENFNNWKIKPIRLLDELSRPIYSFTEEVIVDEFKGDGDEKSVHLPFFSKAMYLEFEDLDSNRLHRTELSLWEKNTSPSPYQVLSKLESSKPEQLFKMGNDTLLLTAGNYELKEKILIPKGKTVIMEAGVNLDLTERAAIVSYSALQLKGTESLPVKIFSSDKTANGIVVLQADQKSKVEYTIFANLNTFDFQNWTLSGAVNFYESEVDIQHSTFEKNHCEDALNIIRTDFKVDNCNFFDIFADAFDSDFCTGELSNSTFLRVGNDAIDFSTSQIKIADCTIKEISDKGISGGEGSTLWVSNTDISDCNIGVASKDLSEVYLDEVSISECVYGLVALKKKPEYGPAQIISTGLVLNECKENLLIEKKSEVDLNGKKISGNKEKVAEMFY